MVFLTITILYSCKSKTYENSTEIFKDGSCQRIMALKGDSSVLVDQVFPILIDESWKKTTETVNQEENTFEVKAVKSFKNVEEMNLEKPNDSINWSKLDHSFNLENKFRWFYSYLTYKETYKKMNPYNLIPVTDYISRDELLLITGEYTEYLAGRDSSEIEDVKKEIEEKFYDWLHASIYEEFMQTLSKNAQLIGNIAITAETIKSKRDTIMKSIKLRMKKNDEFIFHIDSVLSVCSICLGNINLDKIRPSESKVFDEYKKKELQFELWIDMVTTADKAKNSAIMPGLLIKTNCKTVIGNEIQWEFTPMKCFFTDYEITVTSRTTNIWAFVVSGGFLVLLIFGLVAGTLVKRRK